MCIKGHPQLVLKMEVIGLVLEGHFGHFLSELKEIQLFCTIMYHRFGLESPNLHKIPSVGIENVCHWSWLSRSFWPFWLRFLGNLLCPHDNFYRIFAKTTELHQIYIFGFSQLILKKMGVIDLDLWGHLVIWTKNSKKQHSMLLLYTDIDRPRGEGVTCPKVLLYWNGVMIIFSCNHTDQWMVQSVCPSVHSSHFFHHVPIIILSWKFQEL